MDHDTRESGQLIAEIDQVYLISQAEKWSKELVNHYCSTDTSGMSPKSYFDGEGFSKLSLVTKLNNEVNFWRLIHQLKRIDFEEMYSTLKSDMGLNETISQDKRFVKLFKTIRSINVLTDRKFKEFIAPMFDKENIDHQRKYVKGLIEYERSLGKIEPSVARRVDNRIKAIINFYGLYFMSSDMTFEPERAKAIYALSYLHPIADSLVDESEFKIISSYSRRIMDPDLDPTSSKEKVLDSLMKDIEYYYTRDKHPFLYMLMYNLHRIQLLSKDQYDDIDLEPMLEISFQKGGWCTALYGYISTGEMTWPQFEWLFKIGAVQQLLDDSMDVGEDMINNLSTAYTSDIRKGKNLDECAYRMHFLEAYLRRSLGDYPSSRSSVSFNITHAFFGQIRLKLFALYLHRPFYSAPFSSEFRSRRPCSQLAFRILFRTLQDFVSFIREQEGGKEGDPPSHYLSPLDVVVDPQ